MEKEALKRAFVTLEAQIKGLSAIKKSFLNDSKKVLPILESRGGGIMVTGVGKSGSIAEKIAATLTSLGHRAYFLHPVEALHGDLGAVAFGDIVLALSFSGESQEVIKLVSYLKKDFGVKVIGFTKSSKSSLGKLSDAIMRVPVIDEGSPHGVAPMASTTTTLVLGDMVASALTSPETFKKGHFARFHPGGGLSLSLRTVSEVMSAKNNVPCVKEGSTFLEALKSMSGIVQGVTGVVNARGILVGVITDGDIRRFLSHKNYSHNMSLRQLMSKKPKAILSDSNLKDALAVMEKFKITSLFVLDDKKHPVGIVHIHDIVEGVIAK